MKWQDLSEEQKQAAMKAGAVFDSDIIAALKAAELPPQLTQPHALQVPGYMLLPSLPASPDPQPNAHRRPKP